MLLDAETGAHRKLRDGCLNVAKTGVLIGNHAWFSQYRCPGGARGVDLETGAELPHPPRSLARRMFHQDGTLIWSSYGRKTWFATPEGPYTPVDVDTLSLTSRSPLWALDRTGAVGPISRDGFETRFEVPDGRAIARVEDDIYVARRVGLTRYSDAGEVVWTRELPIVPTTLASSEEWVAVGDLDGGVTILDHAGEIRAQVRGHQRRVSGLHIEDGVLTSGSWDGTARRWDLSVVDTDRDVLITRGARWGLGLEEVLVQPSR